MSEAGEVQLTDEQLKTVKNAFNKYDTEKNKKIPVEKLADMMGALKINLSKDQGQEIIDLADPEDSGVLEYDLLVPCISKLVKDKEDELFYKNLFRILDTKSRGWIAVADLRFIMIGLKDEVGLTEEEIDDMITAVDDDGNGEVSFDEFYALMTSE